MDTTQIFSIAFLIFVISAFALVIGLAMQRRKKNPERERIARQKRELLQGGESDAGDTDEAEAPPPEGASPKAASGQGAQAPAAESAVDPLEILNVLRDPLAGSLAVRFQGKTLRNPRKIPTGQRVQLKNLLSELEVWAGIGELRKPAAAPVPPPPAAGRGKELEAPDEPSPFEESLPRRVEVADILPFRRSTIPRLDDSPPQTGSIAVQINAILQEMLARSPLAGREIRLYESADGALRIVDGEFQYTAVQAVDDPQARAMIQAAVKAWNDKNRPGGGSGR